MPGRRGAHSEWTCPLCTTQGPQVRGGAQWRVSMPCALWSMGLTALTWMSMDERSPGTPRATAWCACWPLRPGTPPPPLDGLHIIVGVSCEGWGCGRRSRQRRRWCTAYVRRVGVTTHDGVFGLALSCARQRRSSVMGAMDAHMDAPDALMAEVLAGAWVHSMRCCCSCRPISRATTLSQKPPPFPLPRPFPSRDAQQAQAERCVQAGWAICGHHQLGWGGPRPWEVRQ